MKKIYLFPLTIGLTVLSISGFAQKKVLNFSDLPSSLQLRAQPDVDGKVLVDASLIPELMNKVKTDTVTVYPNWPITLTGDTQRGGIYCNLDEDPDLEIVYCVGTNVFAWNIDGSVVEGFPQPVQYNPTGAPAFGDVDGDGEGEIVVSTASPGTQNQGKLFVFKKDGSSAPGFPINLNGGATKTPVLADLDGDDILEIIVEERSYPNGYVGVYKGNGTTFPGWPQTMDYIPASAVAVGDITGDNIPEIVAESYYSVFAYYATGDTVEGFPYTPGNDRVFSYSSPVLADLDGDGKREIVVGDHSLSAGNGAVHIIKYDGTAFPNWPKQTGQWIYGPPSVGDIDGNGELDIAVGDQVLSGVPTDRVYVWDKNGSYLPGWPSTYIWAINNQIILADLDGDNQIELMWDDNTSEGKYLGYNHDGTPMDGWPVTVLGSTFFNNPFVTDINNDGFVDISGAGKDIGGSNSYFYLWHTDQPIHPELNVLPVLQYNVRHDGVYVDVTILNAGFLGNPLEMCLNGDVQFTDQTTGNPTSWSWTFEGGTPATSTDQNPVVTYQNPGEWDVALEVSDGSTTSSLSKTNYIKVQNEAVIPDIPVGPTQVFTSQTNITYYDTYSSNANQYSWELSP